MSIKLSICIPTYNRAAFIGQTIESVTSQVTDEVEIVISDNASQDDTEKIVRSYQQKFPRITYFRWDKNMGADRNYLKVVELAQGEYCWLMGSDDKVEEGGVVAVLNAIKLYPGLAGISVDRNAYTFDMSRTIAERPVAGGKIPGDKLFEKVEEVFSLLGEYFGYLSGQIISRRLWGDVLLEKDVTIYFNAYVHVYIMANMLLKNSRWLYLNQKCVGWRSENDSFLSEGIFRRLQIDVIGYERIARDVFGKRSAPYHNLMKTVATVHVRSPIRALKYRNAAQTFYFKAFPLCVKAYWRYPSFWLKTFPYLLIYTLMPNFVFNGLRFIWGRTLKKPFYYYLRNRSRIVA